MKNRIPTYFVLAALLLMAACGFKPRGSVPQVSLAEPVQIVGVAKYSALHKSLSNQLQRAGVKLVDKSVDALTLRISDHRSTSRLLTVDSGNDSVERELEESFKFTLRHPQRGNLIETQPLRVLRILYQPETERLGSDREEDRLRDDMRRDLAKRLLRQLRTVK